MAGGQGVCVCCGRRMSAIAIEKAVFSRFDHVLTAEAALSGAMLERSQYAPSSRSSWCCGEESRSPGGDVEPEEASRMLCMTDRTSASVGDVALSSMFSRGIVL